MKFRKPFLVLSLLIILSLPAILPLFHKGVFLSDDGEWMVIRFSAFHQALADGQLPVRWLGRLNHEYGYPVANFLYPGFMYIAEPIHLLGFGFVDSIKIIFGLSMIGSLIFSYLWLRKRFETFASLVGSLFYLYMPYHLYDIYKRGSVGELLALAVLPFIFWQIERKSFVWVSLGIGMLILSHNTLAVLFLPLILIYMCLRKVSSIKYQVSSIILGLGLSAFFWVPALYDLQYTKFSQTQISNWSDHFASLPVIGIAAVVLLSPIAVKKRSKEVLFFTIIGILGIFLSLPVSSSLWSIIPVPVIQFPFRFLSLLIPATSFVAAFVIAKMQGNKRYITGLIMIILLAVSSTSFLKPTEFFDKGDSYYATNEDTTNVKQEYMPKWVKQIPSERPPEKVEKVEKVEQVGNVIAKSNKVSFQASMTEDGVVRVNTIYFPGWGAFIDGKKASISYENEKGVMDVAIPKRKHEVLLQFGETSVRLASDAISLIALLTLGVFAIRKRVI